MRKASMLLFTVTVCGLSFLTTDANAQEFLSPGLAKSADRKVLLQEDDKLEISLLRKDKTGTKSINKNDLSWYFDSGNNGMRKTKGGKGNMKRQRWGKSKGERKGKAKARHSKKRVHPEKHDNFQYFFNRQHSMPMIGFARHSHHKHHANDSRSNHHKRGKHKHDYSLSFHNRRSHHGKKPKPISEHPREKLNPTLIPKFVADLHIPIVLYDANVNRNVDVSMRQISQQVLPPSFPKTTLWAYGNPDLPSTFTHPAGTIENTVFKTTTVTSMNELVVDPVECRKKPDSAACNYLVHVIQDKNGIPLVDQTLHWAAPNQKCANGETRTDCRGSSTEAYTGPVPMTTHVHGAHVEYHSDGYPESWFLPSANNIPSGYATQGRYYSTNEKYSKSSSATEGQNPRGQGSAVCKYDNSETSTTLFYHDHSLGLTRLNVYAAGGGFWLIRKRNDRDDFMGRNQTLPGPPPTYGLDPNLDLDVRKTIREIPILIQQMSFYDDGGLFFPANRVFFANSTCSDGDVFADTSGMPNIPFLPSTKSDLSPIWNPEAFFDTWVVNGNTWPKLEVAPERYRFRLLNIADSASLNIFLKTSDGQEELPIYIIGSEQGLLPNVVGMRTGNFTVYYGKQGSEKYNTKTVKHQSESQAFLIDPGERYDVIVDFSGFSDGTEIIMYNTAPDSPFQGFDSPDYAPANIDTTGQVMKFIVKDELKNPEGDKSTLPFQLRLKAKAPKSDGYHGTRDLFIIEADSTVCVDTVSCDAAPTQCNSNNSFGPVMAMLGYGRKNTSTPSMWSDPICMNPKNGTTEILHLWNWTPDAHPIHIHLVNFAVLGRYDITEFDKSYDGTNPFDTGVKPVVDQLAYELMKDIAIAYPQQVTQLLVTFDRPGLYVWHCHILSHEDNEMMLPFCVGEPGVDCPAELFVGSESMCPQ